jgi:transcriptional regulator with XRE-family HTH domain
MRSASGSVVKLKSLTLRKMRLRIPLDQKEAATRAGLNVVHYRRIEYGQHPGVRVGTVRKLAKAFSVEPAEMVKILDATVAAGGGK